MERGCREPEQSGNGAEKSENLVEGGKNLVEESRGPVVPESCSTGECLANPAAALRGPDCSSPTFMAALALTGLIPLESAAVLVDLSQPTPSLPRLVSVHSWEAVGQNCPPLAAGTGEEPLSLLGGSVGPLSRPRASRKGQKILLPALKPSGIRHSVAMLHRQAPGWLSESPVPLGHVCHLKLLLGCLQGQAVAIPGFYTVHGLS